MRGRASWGIDVAPKRHAETFELLRQVEGLTPRPSIRIEDLVVRKAARERLAEGATAFSKLRVGGGGAL